MKRLNFILTALLLIVAMPSAWAAWVVGDDVVPVSQLKTGQLYVLETASCEAALGHYLKAGTTTPPSLVDSLCVWELVEVPEKNAYTNETQYYLKNFKTGEYLYRAGTTYASTENATPWLIHSTGDSVAYNGGWLYFNSVQKAGYTPGWDENSATVGQTVLNTDGSVYVSFLANYWTDGIRFWSYRDTNPWNFRAVSNDNDAKADLQVVIDEYDSNNYDTYFPASDTQPFATKTSFVTALKDAYAKAVEMSANESATKEQIVAAQVALQGAIAACKSRENKVPLTTGYYYIKTSNSQFASNPEKANMAWGYTDEYPARVRWQLFEDNMKLNALWYVMVNGDGSAQMQNMYSGYYIDGPTSDAASQWYLCVSSGARDQIIEDIGKGQFVAYPKGNTHGNRYAHQNQHQSGAGTGNWLVTWSYSLGSGSSWHFEPETDQSFIDLAKAGLVQRVLDNKLSSLISAAENKIKASTVKTVFYSNSLVTESSQFSTNNIEKNEGIETSQMYKNLLDGKTGTYFHTAWSNSSDVDDAYHYLQIKTSTSLPESVQMYWYRRTNNNNNRPTNVGISVSSDGTNWSTVIDSLKGMPTASDTSFYISPSIKIPAGNTYFRMTVYETNNGALSPVYKHPFFTLSEFRLLENARYDVDPTQSQSARPEVAAQIVVLQAALDAAKAVEQGKTTQGNIDALQEAIDSFNAVWADSATFTSDLAKAEALLVNAVPGEEMGQFPQSAISALQAAVEVAKAEKPLYSKTKTQVDAITKTLSDALSAYTEAMVIPENGKWYFIVSQVSTVNRPEEGDNAQPTREQVVYAGDYGVGSNVLWGGKSADNVSNARAAWRFIKQDDGTYAIQNVGSGWYLGQGGKSGTTVQLSDTIVKYNFIPLTGNAAGDKESAGGQIGLESVVNPILLHAQWANKRLVNWTSNPAGNSACAWTFEEVSTEEQQEIKAYMQDRYYVVTVPYHTMGTPITSDDADITFYTLTGATRGEDGVISDLKFSTYDGEKLTPGIPYLMKVGKKNSDVENDTVWVDMQLDTENVEVINSAVAVNGLHGVLTSTVLSKVGYGYFNASEKIMTTKETGNVTIAAQEGYVVAQDVQNIAGTANDLVIVVDGDGLVNNIKDAAVISGSEKVNVYTIDGVLVKKNVKATTAVQGLQKGIYIIGNKKVAVK